MKGDRFRGPLQRHVYLHAFGWTPDGYEPRHGAPYDEEREHTGRGRHRMELTRRDMRLQYRDLLHPLMRLARA